MQDTLERRPSSALAWSAGVATPHALSWLETPPSGKAARHTASGNTERRTEAYVRDRRAACQALQSLFAAQDFPTEHAEEDLHWRRDALGKPYLQWSGQVAEWAAARGYDSRCLHVSNTHDGPAHIVLLAYDETLVGIGVDAVYLPRLRLPGKEAAYLRRFARQFMAEEELAAFAAATLETDEEGLRIRVAAHFSLMEAASKACGTGLKIGVGMGAATSLPKASLGALRLEPQVELLIGPEAQARLTALGATRQAGYWGADDDTLLSAVFLWR